MYWIEFESVRRRNYLHFYLIEKLQFNFLNFQYDRIYNIRTTT